MLSWVAILSVVGFALLSIVIARLRRPRPAAPTRVSPLVHSINDDRCVGCDACVEVCPTDVLELVSNKSRVMRFSDCIGCEQCALVCPTSALVMHPRGTEPPRVRAPALDEFYQAAPGLYLIGEAAGKPLVKNASNLGRVVIEHLVKGGLRPGAGRTGEVDVAIVGSGPGGLSAALSCAVHGLSYVVFEKDAEIASTIASYPKGKHVMAEPYDVRCLGALPVWDATKEELLRAWHALLDERGIAVRTRHTVESMARQPNGRFELRVRDGKTTGTVLASRVVLAIGTRGTPRRLGVPGEHLPKVSPLLRDPAQHRGQQVLVVGGGDSAVEAALALADHAARVTLSYRQKALSRCKARNRQALEEAIAKGKVHPLFRSKVIEIRPDSVVLTVGEERVEIPNHHAFVCIGGDPPARWLAELGVRFTDEPHQARRPPTDRLLETLIGPQRETRRAGRALAQVAAAALLGALALGNTGCLDDLVPYSGPANEAYSADGSAPSVDYDANPPAFQTDIMDDITRLGCPSCHNGGPPMKLIPSPATAADWMANYDEFHQRASAGDLSLVLTKNLAGSGVSHGGGTAFSSKSDPIYVRWLAWINQGAPP